MSKTLIKYPPLVLATLLLQIGCGSDSTTTDSTDPSLQIGAATSADYVALRVQAEHYTSLTGGWTTTSEGNIPTIVPDPDPPHHSSSGNQAYVELLPDTRVTDEDKLIPGENFWGGPGNGPRLVYNIDIPEPGRYFVFAKAYSTGPEDNGIHVGLNQDKPQSGQRLQHCSGKNYWTWSSAQRTDTNHCGVTKTIFLDIESAGSHDIVFYAREDGYELDQFVLLKDLNADASDCFPINNDNIRCVNPDTGSTIGNYRIDSSPVNNGNIVGVTPPPAAAIVDLRLQMNTDIDSLTVEDQVEYTIKIDNLDAADTATNIKILVTLPTGLSFISSDNCNASGNQLTCNFSEIAPDEQVSTTFTASPDITGVLRVDAQVSADQQDTTLGNNIDSAQVEVSEVIPDFDGALSVIQGPNALGLNDTSTHLVMVHNAGQQEFSAANLEINSDSLLTVTSSNSECSSETTLICTIENIQPGDSSPVPLTIGGLESGSGSVTIQLSVDGDDTIDNNTLTLSVAVIEENIITDTDGTITLEAESFVSQSTPNEAPLQGAYNSAWFVVSDTLAPTINPDFDSASATTASNAAYIEFLPDTRVGTNDPVVINVSNYQNGGESSVLDYKAFINEAGRYYVAALVRATNEQDSSIHFGMNDEWPESARNVSVCNTDGNWQWATKSDCASDATSYLEIATPGIHNLQLSAATDGVEVDKILLLLDNSELPLNTTPSVYAQQDIDLEITQKMETGVHTFSVSNLHESATAADILLQISGIDTNMAETFSGFDGCNAAGEIIECDIDYVLANSTRSATVNSDSTQVSATIISANDSVTSNNMSTITASGGGGLVDLKLLLLLAFSYCVASLSLKNQLTRRS